jgi:nucleotide-binding universal stress UspA family protein
MFEKILVAIDFSTHTHKILECVGRIPGVKHVVLLHVFDATESSIHGWTYGPAIENARILMEEKKKFFESRGYVVTGNVEVLTGGDVYKEILQSAESQDISLIVTGVHGKDFIGDILLKNVTMNILRHAKTSVLVYPDAMIEEMAAPGCERSCPELFSSVLIPTDFSSFSRSVVVWAKDIPKIGEFTILNVVDHGESEHEIEEFEHTAQKNLDEFANDLSAAGIRVKTQIRVGNRVEKILSAAEADNASVILMSPTGTGGFMELFIGSTTFEVVKRTKRPVLIFRIKTNS